MHVHSRAYVCIINEKTKGKFPGELHVVWIGKQNIAAEKVYLSWGGGGGVGGGGKQDALSGLGEIVNFPFVELLSRNPCFQSI